MEKIKKVLACVDFSDYSKEIVEYSLAVTRGTGSETLLLNVINGRDVNAVRSVSPYFPGGFTVDGYVEDQRSKRRIALQELVEKICPTEASQTQSVIGIGVPFEEILKTIKSEQVDLVVMGNKGRGNIAGTLFGSNAEKVFRHASVPVFSVRNRDRFGRGIAADQPAPPRSTVPLQRIVVAVDLSIYSPSVLAYASDIAKRTSAMIVVVHVINKTLIESMKKAFNQEHPDMFSLEKFLSDEMAKRASGLADLIKGWVAKEIQTRTVIRIGTPFEEILRAVDLEKADLLVMNSKGRSNLAGYLFGTTAEKTFRHCPIPVLTLNLAKK